LSSDDADADSGAFRHLMTKQLSLRIVGMTCGGCVNSVEKALRGVAGVASAQVNLMTESAAVTVDNGMQPSALIAAVRTAGYDAEVAPTPGKANPEQEDAGQREKNRRNRQVLIQAVMFALPILVLDHFQHVIWSHTASSQAAGRMLQFVLMIMFMVSPAGAPILVGGVRAMLRGAANMDTLITLGVGTATVSSVYGVFIARDERMVHLHAAAMILLLVAVGRYLEARARGRASAAMSALARRTPRVAMVMREERLVSTPIDELRIGDVVRVAVHHTIPVDGIILDGTASIDESLMTGEPMPVTRQSGERVMGGTVVQDGSILVRATAIGLQSVLARISQLVADAQTGTTRMQRMADRLAEVFTHIVIAIAIATFVGWRLVGGPNGAADAIAAATAVLVVACPCALGLATPTVVVVASAIAALRGILVRDAAMLENMGRVNTIVWDKTGTITAGRPSVRWIRPVGAMDEVELLSLAGAAEQLSTHPIAKAIEAHARRKYIDLEVPDAFESVPGGGVSATVRGRNVLVGSLDFLDLRGVAEIRSIAKRGAVAQPGDSIVAVAVDGLPVGVIALSDAIRPSAAQAVGRLSKLGLSNELLTGDREETARAVGEEVGIAMTAAACSPADKVARIIQLRGQRRVVAMVGDGVNDAAALAAADVGVAFATGADVACEAAGINLIGSTPHLVADAVELARSAVRIIRQNLFWAFVYNVLMIPLAAMGKLPPGLAAGAMMISSLTVVLNALRLPRVFNRRARLS
jgi:Cu+-exporting ATPase